MSGNGVPDSTSHRHPHAERDETVAERADRNWNEVLQELRVLQTGAQILTGFLLALAFQPAFSDLKPDQRVFYLGLVVVAALSAIIALAPVAVHRFLFKKQMKDRTVRFGNIMLLVSLAAVSALIVGVVAFVFDVVAGRGAAIVAAIVFGVLVIIAWAAIPSILRTVARKGD
ncbi:MAG: DUF6328 family protein [Gulosibacter sp.]|uniref:DUF6328 family protein n=1 Tax=Gulosibacter sp. TaxID=2817531 RepID=UPI003F912E24